MRRELYAPSLGLEGSNARAGTILSNGQWIDFQNGASRLSSTISGVALEPLERRRGRFGLPAMVSDAIQSTTTVPRK
jgi:hypothetical protein